MMMPIGRECSTSFTVTIDHSVLAAILRAEVGVVLRAKSLHLAGRFSASHPAEMVRVAQTGSVGMS